MLCTFNNVLIYTTHGLDVLITMLVTCLESNKKIYFMYCYIKIPTCLTAACQSSISSFNNNFNKSNI